MLQLLKLKPGVQTSEFGVTVAGAVIALLSALGVHFSDPGTATSNLAMILALVWGAVYIAGRAVQKAQQVRAAPSAYIDDAVDAVTHKDLSQALESAMSNLRNEIHALLPVPAPQITMNPPLNTPPPVSSTVTFNATNTPPPNPNL